MSERYRPQEPPYAVQVELTEGCNLRCTFCGLNGIRGERHDFKFMDPTTAAHVANLLGRAGWNPRIEFAMHGEPTLNRARVDVVQVFRERLPGAHVMMTSNGGGLLGRPGPLANVVALYEAGLNVLALDEYEGVDIVPRIRAAVEGQLPEWVHTFFYPQDPYGNPHTRRRPNARVLVYVKDISVATAGTHATLNNHAGAGGPLNDHAQGKRCAKPFRELSIRWDGSVAVCCNDWRGIYKVGNVLDYDDLDELWNGPAMGAIRRRLYHGMRDVGPCSGCDATSYRTGLLPDPKGLAQLPTPDEEDDRVAAAACAGQPYTAPVVRPWEAERTNLVQLRTSR